MEVKNIILRFFFIFAAFFTFFNVFPNVFYFKKRALKCLSKTLTSTIDTTETN